MRRGIDKPHFSPRGPRWLCFQRDRKVGVGDTWRMAFQNFKLINQRKV